MTINHYTETATPDATKRYPSDLNNREFDLVAPHVAQKAGSDKKRIVDICEVLNAIVYRRRWLPIPAPCRRFQPGDDLICALRILPLQSAPF